MSEIKKPKLSIDEQINYMQEHGIMFKAFSKEKARDFISNNTYFFKIKSYCKNFNKNADGKYINLDFFHLNELSVMDLHLRKMIISMALNIEHSLKAILNYHLSTNENEDGYEIVAQHIKVNETKLEPSKYNRELYDKYKDKLALWNYVELLTFGDLISFFNFYFEKYPNDEFDKIYRYLFNVKHLRNAAAHNNCLLCNIRKQNIEPNKKLKALLNNSQEFKNFSLDKKLCNSVLHDFAALLACFNYLIKGSAMIKHTYSDLRIMLDRMKKNIATFKMHSELISFLTFFEKLVDFFEKEAYNIITEQKLS